MSDKITYEALVSQIADESGETKERIDAFLKELVETTDQGLERDGKVNIANFGIFELRKMAEKQGIDPQTRESITIPEHTRVAFKASRSLSRKVNKQYEDREPEFIDDDEPGKEPEEEQRRRYRPAVISALSILLILIIAAFFLFRNGSDSGTQIAGRETAGSEVREPGSPDEMAEAETRHNSGIASRKEADKSAKKQASDESAAVIEHTVNEGETLWDMAGTHYNNAYFWPNIYRVNADEINDPDLIFAGTQLSVPQLEGSGSDLTARDSADIAKGYLMVYETYNNSGYSSAGNYLRVANNYDAGVTTEENADVVRKTSIDTLDD